MVILQYGGPLMNMTGGLTRRGERTQRQQYTEETTWRQVIGLMIPLVRENLGPPEGEKRARRGPYLQVSERAWPGQHLKFILQVCSPEKGSILWSYLYVSVTSVSFHVYHSYLWVSFIITWASFFSVSVSLSEAWGLTHTNTQERHVND